MHLTHTATNFRIFSKLFHKWSAERNFRVNLAENFVDAPIGSFLMIRKLLILE